jgi:hypothetical protein
MTTKPIRISSTAYETASRIAKSRGCSIQQVLDDAIDALNREVFFKQLNEAAEKAESFTDKEDWIEVKPR